MSDNPMSALYADLASAQAKMTRARKDAKNPHFGKQYADLASVQDACMTALGENGFAVFQPVVEEGDALYVSTVLAHKSGESISCRIPLMVNKRDMQGLGSAITYARRYGLMCMSGVAPDDDDGNAAAEAPPPSHAPKAMTDTQRSDQISDDMAELEDAKTLSELQGKYAAIFRRWGQGQVPVAIDETKEAMKAKLQEEQQI